MMYSINSIKLYLLPSNKPLYLCWLSSAMSLKLFLDAGDDFAIVWIPLSFIFEDVLSLRLGSSLIFEALNSFIAVSGIVMELSGCRSFPLSISVSGGMIFEFLSFPCFDRFPY